MDILGLNRSLYFIREIIFVEIFPKSPFDILQYGVEKKLYIFVKIFNYISSLSHFQIILPGIYYEELRIFNQKLSKF